MPGAPRLSRARLRDAMRWVAEGRVPTPEGGRSASEEELVRFAGDALAPFATADCSWCGGAACPACGVDRERALRSRVLREVRARDGASGREIAAALGVGRVDVIRELDVLRREGMIRRTGSGRYGMWVVVPAGALARVP
jgi:hypothetical protein